MEQHCDKHNQFKPCQQCAKEAVWEGEALIFKRDAEREIDQLRKELEEAKDEVSCLSDLWKSDVDAYTELGAEVERLESALEKIRDEHGKVCNEYEICTHISCASSHAAWVLADQALKEGEMPFSGITYCDKCGDSSSTGNPCHRCQISTLTAQLEKLEGDYDTALQWNMELEEQLASAQAKAEVERRVLEKLWGAARRHITELEAEVEWGARG
jgi:septal ring factor EnvC (AmiA/AmiB activator)